MQNEELNNIDYNAPLQPVIQKTIPEAEIPTPNNPPWNFLAAFGVWVMSIVFIIFLPLIFLAPYLIKNKEILADPAAIGEFAMKDSTAVILQLAAIIPAHILTLLLAWLVVTRFKKYSFKQTLGWDWNGFKVWHAFVITFFFYGVAFLLTAIFGKQENEFDKMLESSRTAVYLVAFLATFTAPIVEEVIYRGIIFSALQKPLRTFSEANNFFRKMQEFYYRHSTFIAFSITTLLFVAIHIPQYSQQNVPDYAAVLTLLMLSGVLTYIRVKTGNLLPCIVLHTIFNGIQALLFVLYPFIQSYIENNSQQPDATPAILLHFLK